MEKKLGKESVRKICDYHNSLDPIVLHKTLFIYLAIIASLFRLAQ